MFSDPKNYLWLIPLCPLLGCAIVALFGKAMLKEKSHWPVIAGSVLSCVFALLLLCSVASSETDIRTTLNWFTAGNVNVEFSLRADGLTAIMLVMVTFIGSWIAIYCVGYMHHDPGYPRFFAAVSGFLFFMTGLVLANNFILLYACWEGVGLCSYLLIGFWFYKPSAAAAARKAFLVTRLGDVGLFLGILMLWHTCDYSLDYDHVFLTLQKLLSVHAIDHVLVTTACLLLFTGAVGKSAQFPLHVWLPDAMEGPSPVSALIHAATMVTAGVYLVARCTPIFALSPDAQLVVACIGAFTALLAGLIALTQTDLKRVLAYSTVSQLGYMFLALGCALKSQHLIVLAVASAIFHLFTHAFFKALLFLGAGSVMHAMGDVIDMRKFSGLRKLLPTTHWTFLAGSAALAGVPLLSGFWSKDEILASALGASHDRQYGTIYLILLLSALATAGLTAFYTFRAYFMTFWGPEKIPAEAGHHAHESPAIMTVPLMVLAVGALLVGIVLGPTGIFEHFLSDHWMNSATFTRIIPEPHPHHMNIVLMIGSSLIALAGVGLAYMLYVKNPAMSENLAKNLSTAHEASRNKFYIDELYYAFIVRPLSNLALILRAIDQYIVDGLVDLIGQVPRFLSWMFLRPIHNGLVQFYALLMALGLAAFLVAMLLK